MTQLNLDIHKNKTNNLVKHEGIVSRISDKTITVSLKGNVNCEGCKAQSACGVSDSNDKEIEVINSTQSFEINEPVDVLLKKEDKISKGTGLIVDSVIKLHRIVTIPKRIIKRKLGEANT